MKKLLGIAAFTMTVFLLLSVFPMAVFALPGDGGNQGLTDENTYEIDNQNVLVFVTENGGYAQRTSGSDSDRTQVYTAYPYDGWEFAGWWTYYEGPITKGSNYEFGLIDPAWAFSKPGRSDQKYESPAASIQVNNELTALGTYYLYAVYKPIVTLISDVSSTVAIREEGVDFHTGSTGTVTCAVGYNAELELYANIKSNVPVSVMENYASVNDYTLTTNGGGTTVEFTRFITRPTTFRITTRPREQVVTFDANGGNGTMAKQEFSYDAAQALTDCVFTRTGYVFAGWNTKADGSGQDYTDEQSVTFKPEADGEEIILYAIWEKHTAHTGGTATCAKKAECSVCGELYGEISLQNHVGETELRNAAEPQEFTDGYTGDLYCLGCGNVKEYGEPIPMTHEHRFDTMDWDDDSHWKECICGEKDGVQDHSFGDWIVTEEPTVQKEGSRYQECSGCDFTVTETMEKLPSSTGEGDGARPDDPNTPATGDGSHLSLWMTLALAALVLAAAMVLHGRRHQND